MNIKGQNRREGISTSPTQDAGRLAGNKRSLPDPASRTLSREIEACCGQSSILDECGSSHEANAKHELNPHSPKNKDFLSLGIFTGRVELTPLDSRRKDDRDMHHRTFDAE